MRARLWICGAAIAVVAACGSESGEPADTLNGCTLEDAVDGTGRSDNTITDLSAWSLPHQACLLIDANSVVFWANSNFDIHPLVGGIPPEVDPDSPLTPANDRVGTVTSVTFPEPGDYPYFCTSHGSELQGVIYVR